MYRGKHGNKKNMNKVKCFNYQKVGHFTKENDKSKRVYKMKKACVISKMSYYSFGFYYALIVDIFPLHIVHLGETNHVMCGPGAFIEY